MEKGCFIVRDKKGNKTRYPLFEKEIGEVQIRSGNLLSSGALTSLAFWQIDTLLLTGRGRPVAIIKSLEDESHVKTRIAQYKSLDNGKFSEIAKQFVIAKIEGQNQVLSKYGLRRLDFLHIDRAKELETTDPRNLRYRLTSIESRCAKLYFDQVFQLFNPLLRPKGRKKFKAYDGLNNLFNLGYEILSWKIHLALTKAKLEPFLGYLHSLQWKKPSLICDFEELYRYRIDDFVIKFALKLKQKDFILKKENFSSNKKGKREYLNDQKTKRFMKSLNHYFESSVKVPRIRVGKKQELESLIVEKAFLFAKYLRDEKKHWTPRIASLA
jgi:CRISPR-associated protein Cas1